MTTLAIIQARCGSSRLPGKVLKDICGRPMIWHVVQRAKRLRGKVVVATTINHGDDELAEWLRWHDIPYYRGSMDNVLKRMCGALESHGDQHTTHIVRVTGDSPLLSLSYLDEATFAWPGEDVLRPTLDIVCNEIEGAELVSVPALEWLVEHWSDDAITREHVTPRLYMHPKAFGVARFAPRKEPRIKLSVDTREDLERVRRVYSELWRGGDHLIRQRKAVALLSKEAM